MDYAHVEVLEEHTVESVVAAHFHRNYPTYYWKGTSELDVIAEIDSHLYGFEVKWGPKSWKKPRAFSHVFLLTKETIPLFLASIKWNYRLKLENDQ